MAIFYVMKNITKMIDIMILNNIVISKLYINLLKTLDTHLFNLKVMDLEK